MALDEYGKILVRGLYERALHSSELIQEMIEKEHTEYNLEIKADEISKFLNDSGRENLGIRDAIAKRVCYLAVKEKRTPIEIPSIILRELRPYHSIAENCVRNILRKNGIEPIKSQKGRGGGPTRLSEFKKEGFKRKRTGRKIIYQSFCSVPETL